ncbi:MAG: DUF2079 domain-containing protein [Actinomycetota bacterium]
MTGQSSPLRTQVPRIDGAGIGAAAALSTALFLIGTVRHRSYWSGFDLAIFDQASWQLSQGRDHISIVDRHVLADHFSPVMYLFGALYRVRATPVWLLAAQAVAMGATILPMRGVARHLGLAPSRATWLAVGSAPLLAAAVFDFHPSTLAVPFIATVLLYAVQDRPAPTALAAVAVLLCRADLALTLLAVAILAPRRTRWLLVAMGGLGALVSAAVPGAFGETNGWSPHFGHLGSSPLQAALHPWDVMIELLSAEALATLAVWVLAAGVVVVMRPRWLLAVVVAGLPVLLSRWPGTALPWYHYGAPVVPIAVAGTLHALAAADLGGRAILRTRWATALCPLAALLVASPLSALAPDNVRVSSVLRIAPGTDPQAALDVVPGGAPISADQHLLPHVSHRERAYLFPIPFADAEGFFAEGSQPDLEDYSVASVDVVVARIGTEALVPSPPFREILRTDGFSVLLRDAEGDP